MTGQARLLGKGKAKKSRGEQRRLVKHDVLAAELPIRLEQVVRNVVPLPKELLLRATHVRVLVVHLVLATKELQDIVLRKLLHRLPQTGVRRLFVLRMVRDAGAVDRPQLALRQQVPVDPRKERVSHDIRDVAPEALVGVDGEEALDEREQDGVHLWWEEQRLAVQPLLVLLGVELRSQQTLPSGLFVEREPGVRDVEDANPERPVINNFVIAGPGLGDHEHLRGTVAKGANTL
mmetsp:Transcript_12831/g.36169  ORF Transcript_12831/g.36169 Transcript_12831/m.36169 type:complete len:234 (+) Transcript_12831:313-1014(+)